MTLCTMQSLPSFFWKYNGFKSYKVESNQESHSAVLYIHISLLVFFAYISFMVLSLVYNNFQSTLSLSKKAEIEFYQSFKVCILLKYVLLRRKRTFLQPRAYTRSVTKYRRQSLLFPYSMCHFHLKFCQELSPLILDYRHFI